jgi:hypothetical protein
MTLYHLTGCIPFLLIVGGSFNFATADGPISPLYLTGIALPPSSSIPGCNPFPADGPVNVNEVVVIQGANVINSWVTHTAPRAYPTTLLDPCLEGGAESALAVGSSIRTIGAVNYQFGGNPAGGEYTVAGVYTGTDFANPLTGLAASEALLDGTRDAMHNYAIGGMGSIYSFDLNWQNPVLLFTLPPSPTAWTGIAYDRTNNSLWVAPSSHAEIQDFSLDGVLLSSFTLVFPPGTRGAPSGLALDPADQSLWTYFGGGILVS